MLDRKYITGIVRQVSKGVGIESIPAPVIFLSMIGWSAYNAASIYAGFGSLKTFTLSCFVALFFVFASLAITLFSGDSEITDEDHNNMNAFIGQVSDDYKNDAITKEQAMSELERVMVVNDKTVRRWRRAITLAI